MCEWSFLYFFTFELVIKVVARGFLHHADAYLHDPWCQIDFVVVSLAWLPLILPGFGNFSSVRALRSLRPLRALKRVPGMPQLVESILSALPRVGNVFLLCVFIMLASAASPSPACAAAPHRVAPAQPPPIFPHHT
jgi:hypothetical protein